MLKRLKERSSAQGIFCSVLKRPRWRANGAKSNLCGCLLYTSCTDELHLEELGEKKVALFCCIPDSEKSLNYLVGLMYGQLIQTLYYEADRKHKGRLPVPVHLLIDEAPNISLPTDSFLTSVSYTHLDVYKRQVL